MKLNNQLFLATALAAVFATATFAQQPEPQLQEKVRHELAMLPYLSVFDQLRYQVDSYGAVTLSGEVVRPTLKSDAARVVAHIPGVTHVSDQIEVLPLSPFDDRIRLAVYRQIFGSSSLQRYAMGALPAIHIIVKNGNVTLEGNVSTNMDKQLAGMRANQVFGVFSVTNELQVRS